MTTLDEAIAAAQRITHNMAGQAPYAGPERRVLDPELPAAPATSQQASNRRPIYYVRTGALLLEVDSPIEQRRVAMLHNLVNGHAVAGEIDERWPADGAR